MSTLDEIRQRHLKAASPFTCVNCGLTFASEKDNDTTEPGDRPDLCWDSWGNCGVNWGPRADWRERYVRDVGILLSMLDQ